MEPVSSPLVSDKVERSLRDIGLTEYETLAYLSLLQSGEMTAEQVSELSSIPYTKVYSVLESLHDKGWVDLEGGRPRRYFPRSPVDALRAEQLRMEAEFERSREVIVEELQPLFEQKDIREMPQIWMVRGEESTFGKVVELIGKARKEIMLVLPWLPTELLAVSNAYIQRIQDSRIKIKVLTTRETVEELDERQLSLAEVRVRDELFGGGLVVDERESLLFLDLALPRGPDMAIWSDHESLTRVSTIYFQSLWESSEPYNP
ncbi:MAG: TrmB family transcriptional regulator [Candidatus Bathyarchaeota archaeon]|nr:MAG: TrmB family transcriptional regulator [Candidatus Bathyarchaeota archaeon]